MFVHVVYLALWRIVGLCSFANGVVSLLSNGQHQTVHIALAGQGKANEMGNWMKMFKMMDTKDQITLFLISNDLPIESPLCNGPSGGENVICLYVPSNSFSAGRNMLARAIRKHEILYKRLFKYWLFGYSEIIQLNHCHTSTTCKGPDYPQYSTELAACCFDLAIDVLSAPEVQYAEINFLHMKAHSPDFISFSHIDCGDAGLVAFHNSAVPVALPYIDLMDKIAWWESQSIHFHVAAGCYPGYSVYSNVFAIKETISHSSHTLERHPKQVEKALHQVYGKVSLIPNPISLAELQLEQGNCAKLNYQSLGLGKVGFESRISVPEGGEQQSALKTLWNSGEWQNSTSFKLCLEKLKPRFMRFVESGNLTEMDGKMFHLGDLDHKMIR